MNALVAQDSAARKRKAQNDHQDDDGSVAEERYHEEGGFRVMINDEGYVKPKRALTAYNLFFAEERRKMLEEQEEKKTPRVGFAEMARTVSARWKVAETAVRDHFEDLAQKDKVRYLGEKKLWKKLDKRSAKLLQKELKKNEQRKKKQKTEAPVVPAPTAAASTSVEQATVPTDASKDSPAPQASGTPKSVLDFLRYSPYGGPQVQALYGAPISRAASSGAMAPVFSLPMQLGASLTSTPSEVNNSNDNESRTLSLAEFLLEVDDVLSSDVPGPQASEKIVQEEVSSSVVQEEVSSSISSLLEPTSFGELKNAATPVSSSLGIQFNEANQTKKPQFSNLASRMGDDCTTLFLDMFRD